MIILIRYLFHCSQIVSAFGHRQEVRLWKKFYIYLSIYIYIYIYIYIEREREREKEREKKGEWEAGVRYIKVIVVGNGHGDPSSNPNWGSLHFS